MDTYSILLYLHILAFVFWLGTDIGVFTLGKFAQNPAHTVDQRLLLLKVALILDMFPRVFMVLTLPTGFHLAVILGGIPSGQPLIMWVWLFSAVWLAVVLVGLLKHEAPIGQQAKVIEKVIQYSLLAGLLWVVFSSWFASGLIIASWLTTKVLLYAGVIAVTPLLEIAFGPAVAGFMALPTEGSTEAIEADIKRGMDVTYIWVIVIYVLVLVAAYLGVAKPF